MIVIYLIIILVLSAFKFYLPLLEHIKCSWKLSGPLTLPFIGNAYFFYRPNAVFRSIHYLRHKYMNKILRFWLGPYLFIYIDNPYDIGKILNAPECVNKSDVYRFIKSFLGDGIFVCDSPKWNEHRKIINPAFAHKILLSFFPIFNKEVDVLCDRLGEKVGKGEFGTQKLMENCIIDITYQTTMGLNIESQTGKKPEIIKSFDYVKAISGMKIFCPWYQIKPFYERTKHYKHERQSTNMISQFIENLIFQKLEKNKSRTIVKKEQEEETKDIASVDHILKSPSIFIDQCMKYIETGQLTIEDVKDHAAFVVIASIDTTALTMSYIILCLACYPEYQEKVREEINLLFPNKDQVVTYEDINNMVYCEMVINETLRLFPSVPFIARQTNADFTFKDDIVLPKGTQIIMDIFHLHRDPRFWGENPSTFNPDNFLPGNNPNRHPYSYIPFSKGPRNCIGWRYAYMSLKIQMAKMFKRYRFTSKCNLKELDFRMEITIKAVKEPLVEIHRIED